MNAQNTSVPAFPALARWGRDGEANSALQQDGMSLRDYFAAAALQGLLADPSNGWEAEEYAEASYAMADAMLEARK